MEGGAPRDIRPHRQIRIDPPELLPQRHFHRIVAAFGFGFDAEQASVAVAGVASASAANTVARGVMQDLI